METSYIQAIIFVCYNNLNQINFYKFKGQIVKYK